jgi:tRNA(His) guanylyltransferase
MTKDAVGDFLKEVEMREAGRKAMPGLPLIVRLDGRAFHTFTRGMERPFDLDMTTTMEIVMKELVEEFHANVGYTQSDEITLVFSGPIPFDGRYQKLCSVLAGYASAVFAVEAAVLWPEKHIIPCFDARVWDVPNLFHVIDVLAWREADAVENSVQMATRAHYSHKQMHGKNQRDMHEMLHAKGVNWNDYPDHFKRGVYAKRVKVTKTLSDAELAKIPAAHRPTGPVERSEVQILYVPPIAQMFLEDQLRLVGRESDNEEAVEPVAGVVSSR